MGYLLKEALKTLCGVNQWSYAIFWKIGCQNPKLLIWEECYYEPLIYSNARHGVQTGNNVHSLVTKMMKDNYINLLGEGLVGRVAFTRNHQWIISDNKMLDIHPPEVSNEVCIQFSAGMQTIAVIPVHPHGVIQLGSSSTIIENMGFVNDVKSLISQLGCVPGALLSENYTKNERALDANPNHSKPFCFENSQKFSFSGKQQTAFGTFSENYDPLRPTERQIFLSDAFFGDHVNVDEPNLASGKQKLEHELFEALTMSSEEACLKPPSRDDLFDVVGMDFENKLFGSSGNNNNNNKLINNGIELELELEANPLNLIKNNSPVLELQGADSGIYSSTASDHLLDAVVSKVHSSSKQISDDNTSCRTSSTKTSYSSSIWGANKSCRSYKSGICNEDGGNFSDTSSIISSQIGSWGDQRDVRDNIAKRADEISKSSRKRLKPGENPRPRPKDRQMIQDRVKELREIVPNGAKCSIDALLERTIKHMLFLQSVTKHADKLKQTGESKIVSKEGGLLLRDNFEGGATWAYEVGSQSMVCPIIVEDLNSPRQMLVEMLCDEGGLFLEIADMIKGLGLTILKGVMESRKDKIWAHFTVEANRDVTRMEIFISLVSLLEQAVKNSGDCGGNETVGRATT